MTSGPVAERERLEAVARHEIIDTPSDGAFDRITALAARLLDAPIAIVSIVDEDRIWFKSHHGLEMSEVGRDPGLCSSAIMQTEPLLIPDARLDPVALTNPLVAGGLGLRFYAGVPLTTPEGHNLGTLCVIDQQPREIDGDQVAVLRELAALVVHELEVRLAARQAVAHAVAEKVKADELAATLQASLLPPRLPRIPGIDVAARYQPADRSQVGGDFYDLFPLADGAWGVAIGDVCGKGPAAAAVTAASRHAVRAAAVEHQSPAAVLRVVNETMVMSRDPELRYCTLVYARLRSSPTGAELSLASGGHPLPAVLRRDGKVESVGAYGTLVGIFDDARFEDRDVTLGPGDTLVFSTDGLSEAPDGPNGGRLGVEGVERALVSCCGQTASEIVSFLAGIPMQQDHVPSDDVAILALQVYPGR